MKETKAIIQLFMLSKVTSVERKIFDFLEMTVNNVRGLGREKGKGALHKTVEGLIDYAPK